MSKNFKSRTSFSNIKYKNEENSNSFNMKDLKNSYYQ